MGVAWAAQPMETTQSSDSIPRANAMAERQKRGLANLAPEGGKDTDALGSSKYSKTYAQVPGLLAY